MSIACSISMIIKDLDCQFNTGEYCHCNLIIRIAPSLPPNPLKGELPRAAFSNCKIFLVDLVCGLGYSLSGEPEG